jgi:hypothetical protein
MKTWSVQNYISEKESVTTVGTPVVKGMKRKFGNGFERSFCSQSCLSI